MAVPVQQQRVTGNVQRPPAPAPAPRLSLSRVSQGKQRHAFWIHVYGPEGVGKSSLGAAAPNPIFIDVEQGTMNIDTTRFVFDDTGRTMPHNLEEFLEAVRVLERETHPYGTLVIDTLDAVEALVWRHVCERDGQPNIAAYGYGKGENIVALDEWRRLIASLERVRAKGVNVLTLSHSLVKRFDDPESEGYDRYILKLHDKAGGLVKERADAVLFARFEITKKKKDKDSKKFMALHTGARFLYTQKTGAYDAKNRYDMPAEIPLAWHELEAAISGGAPAESADLVAAITATAERLGAKSPQVKVTALKYLADAGEDPVKLSKINSWINAKLAEAGLDEEA